MTLWIVLTIMTAVAAVLVSTPFIRRLERRRAESALDVAVYRDQLKEIEAEASQGLIEPAQAEAAKSEIKRRVLAAARDGDAVAPGLSSGERVFAAIGVAAVVVIGSIGLFALTADLEPRSDYAPAESDRTANDEETSSPGPRAKSPRVGELIPPTPAAAPRATMQARPLATAAAGRPTRPDALPSVDELIQRIVKRLEANPKDVGGWRMLGWSYAGVERYNEAAGAYAQAMELAPKVAEFRSARAESLIRAANGVVTPEAKTLVQEALERDPKDSRARYFEGLIKEQDGDGAGALADWRRLADEGDPNDLFILDLKRKIARIENSSGASVPEPSEDRAGQAALSSSAAAPVERGPTALDAKNAETMDPSDRMAVIRRMVESLAARLEKSPHDADGWIKLIRSRTVLEDDDRAREALNHALKVFESEPASRERIAATGRELGLAR